MDDLDFLQPAQTPAQPAPAPKPALAEPSPYDPRLALRFFQIAGEAETFPAGAGIFAEQDKTGGFFAKGARIYLLLEGEVALTLKGKPLSLVLPGEIFGELAVISEAPRSATATARRNSRVLSLDEKRFLASLQQLPEFAFMLIGIMAQRLRHSIDRLLSLRVAPAAPRRGGGSLSQAMLADLRRAMGDPTPTPMKAGDTIVTKGAVGVSMFVLVAGRASIALGDRVIETIGPGETFGETALLGPTARAATVTAATDGAWLPISRDNFLQTVKTHPNFGIALLRSMSERIQYNNALIGG